MRVFFVSAPAETYNAGDLAVTARISNVDYLSTLAVNALGDVPDVNNILVVEAAGPDLQISVNGVPALAATDNAHSSGSVGLFSMSGQTPQVRNSPPWAVTFNAVPNGIKTVTASLRDAGNNQIESNSIDIAVGGDYILAIGDMQSLVSRLFAEGMDVHVATLTAWPIVSARSSLPTTCTRMALDTRSLRSSGTTFSSATRRAPRLCRSLPTSCRGRTTS